MSKVETPFASPFVTETTSPLRVTAIFQAPTSQSSLSGPRFFTSLLSMLRTRKSGCPLSIEPKPLDKALRLAPRPLRFSSDLPGGSSQGSPDRDSGITPYQTGMVPPDFITRSCCYCCEKTQPGYRNDFKQRFEIGHGIDGSGGQE
jgi:hypothetical protein